MDRRRSKALDLLVGEQWALGVLVRGITHKCRAVADDEHVIFDGQKHFSIGSLPEIADRTITAYTFSKTYAMTGLRLGYMATNDDLIVDRCRKLLRLTTNGVPSITQWGGVAALTGSQDAVKEMARELEVRRNIFFEGLQTIKAFESFKPGGAFYVWSKISDAWPGYQGKRDSWAMTNYLIDQAGVGTSPGIASVSRVPTASSPNAPVIRAYRSQASLAKRIVPSRSRSTAASLRAASSWTSRSRSMSSFTLSRTRSTARGSSVLWTC